MLCSVCKEAFALNGQAFPCAPPFFFLIQELGYKNQEQKHATYKVVCEQQGINLLKCMLACSITKETTRSLMIEGIEWGVQNAQKCKNFSPQL